MTNNENLNLYKDAYKDKFEFFDENHWYLNHYAKIMSSIIREEKYASVLSLGIGHEVVSDMMLNELNHNLKKYVILEGAEEIIENFLTQKKPSEKVETVHIYFENYETDEKFDVIEMGFVLEHVDDPALIVSKYAKLLKKGGSMFISVPNAKSLHRVIGHEAGLLDDYYKLSPADLELGHKRYFDLESITKLMEDNDLKIVKTTGLMLKPITGKQLTQLGWDKDENILKALFKVGEKYPEIANCILLQTTV